MVSTIKFPSRLNVPVCLFCDNQLDENTKPEHVLLNGLGGRKTTKLVDCSSCNNRFGSTIDKVLTHQGKVLRNLLQLPSGDGKQPPKLRGIRVGQDTYNLRGDGTPELVGKPFRVIRLDDETYEISVVSRSQEELALAIPHLAAQIGCSEEEIVKHLQNAKGKFISKRPGMMPFGLSLGGPEALRSVVKSCLVLWSVLVGNDEVRSAPYELARQFVLGHNDSFNNHYISLDARALPCAEILEARFGHLFNFIYIKSDDAGRVIGHFTLYNIVSWQVVLAESSGITNRSVALASNPLNPAEWSDKVAGQADVDFSWLASPSFEGGLQSVRERFGTLLKRHFDTEMPRQLQRIVNDVCARHGILSDDEAISDALWPEISREISERSAHLIVGVPYERTLSPDEIATFLPRAKPAK